MSKTRQPIGQDGTGALMRDVAKLAGVATSTVSRALANPGRVNEETRLKIAAAAEQLGYTPNAAARNLRVGKSNIIMIVLPGPLYYGASQVVPEVLTSIDAALVKQGFNLLVSNLDRLEATEGHILDLAFGGTVRGAIVLSSELPSSGNRSLRDAGIPIVSLLRDLSGDGVLSVVTNDRAAMREATDHLLALGHRSFFYIPGPRENYHEIERFAGLKEAVEAAGLSPDAVIRFAGEFDFQSGLQCGAEAAKDYLALKRRPTAAVSCSDDAAISFMSRVQGAGVAVPRDLSVIGFDGAAVGEFCYPGLTTLQQPTGNLGSQAADLLLRLLNGEIIDRTSPTVLPSALLLRSSTASPGERSVEAAA